MTENEDKKENYMTKVADLTAVEVRLAQKRKIFVVTSETNRGYIVRCFKLPNNGGPPILLAKARECVLPRTARRYSTKLVRAVLDGGAA